MITQDQQDQATRFVLGELSSVEADRFKAEVHRDGELREFLHSLQRTVNKLTLAGPIVSPSAALKEKVMSRLRPKAQPAAEIPARGPVIEGLRFLANSEEGWKPLPIPGAFIKLLSLQADRGYAVLLGKLAPGVRYPAHINAGPEDFYILTGDLHVGSEVLRPGDFHHADAGSHHGENYSIEGCTLMAVLTTDDRIMVKRSQEGWLGPAGFLI